MVLQASFWGIKAEDLEKRRVLEGGTHTVAESQDPEMGETGQ